MPDIATCKNAAFTAPLEFEPEERWEYGISMDWVGKLVEAVSDQSLEHRDAEQFSTEFFEPWRLCGQVIPASLTTSGLGFDTNRFVLLGNARVVAPFAAILRFVARRDRSIGVSSGLANAGNFMHEADPRSFMYRYQARAPFAID
jgi:hypothetical protein